MKWEEDVARGQSVILGRLKTAPPQHLCGVRDGTSSPPGFQYSSCPPSHEEPFPAELHPTENIHPLQTPPKAVVAPGATRAPNACTWLAALSAALQALCHALATRKAPRGAGHEDDKSTEEPLRSTTVQRKGNSIGMKAIPLHWRCHHEHSGAGQIRGAQTQREDMHTGRRLIRRGRDEEQAGSAQPLLLRERRTRCGCQGGLGFLRALQQGCMRKNDWLLLSACTCRT